MVARADGRRWGEAEDEAFLTALKVLGKVELSARVIGWTARTAYTRRCQCPAFARSWDALKRPAAPPLPKGQIRKGKLGARGGFAGPKYVRGQTKWIEAVERAFLDMLATTCNVSAACQAAGISTDTVYSRRLAHPEFERRWNAAVAQGYARLEAELLRAAAESVEGVTFTERAIGPVSAETVLKLLGMHRATASGQGGRTGHRAKPQPIEDVLESIRRRAAAIRAARKDAPPQSPGEPSAGPA